MADEVTATKTSREAAGTDGGGADPFRRGTAAG